MVTRLTLLLEELEPAREWRRHEVVTRKLANISVLTSRLANLRNESGQRLTRGRRCGADPRRSRRQMMYARKIKDGIPAAKPPPPFVVKKPKMSQWWHRNIRGFDVAKPSHDEAYGGRETLSGTAWSCCGSMDEHSLGGNITASV
jgi:hypothetical protein